jgi:hypothetical protein
LQRALYNPKVHVLSSWTDMAAALAALIALNAITMHQLAKGARLKHA